MIDGKVEITPKPDGKIDPIQLLKATYDSGVSVAEMSMIAHGQILKDASGAIAFQTGPSQSFIIVQNIPARQLQGMAGAGKHVTINGLLYEKQKGQKKQTVPASLTLTVVEIQQTE